MRSFLLLILGCCLVNSPVFSGEFSVDKYADTFFSGNDYDSIIYDALAEIARDQDVPEAIFKENYQWNKARIYETIFPLVKKKFQWVRNNTSQLPREGSKAWSHLQKTYFKELYRGARDATQNNPQLQFQLYSINEEDRILSFDSELFIQKNGEITVVEHIVVYNGNGMQNAYYLARHPESASINDDIQRGIVRDFPTIYNNRLGLRTLTGFNVLDVKKNGESENYFTERLQNGVRLFTGYSSILLDKGVYRYDIKYITNYQLKFLEDVDELYWNVTGNEWVFSIGGSTCTIHFPKGSKIVQNACYTGAYGSKESNCKSEIINDSTLFFTTNGGLEPLNGFTVAAGIENGILEAPSKITLLVKLLKENIPVSVMLLVFIAIVLWNIYWWFRVGKDPKSGVIIPRFEPPKGMSPADVGFIAEQKFVPELFSAALIDCSVRGEFDIYPQEEGSIFKKTVYSFGTATRQRSADSKTYEWYNFDADSLIGQKIVSGKYNSKIASILNGLERHLQSRWQGDPEYKGRNNRILFNVNNQYTSFGIILLFLSFIGGIVMIPMHFSIPSFIIVIVLFIASIIVQVIFAQWLKAYTDEGRKLLDEIEGFKMYLNTAEAHVYDRMNPPEMTIQLFERYLPYAIALGVENRWSEKFEQIIETAIQSGDYQPSYYRGAHLSSTRQFSTFAHTVSAGLSSTVSSASTPPSSSSGGSSGSSGGGFSGGGGGGGGGGGW